MAAALDQKEKGLLIPMKEPNFSEDRQVQGRLMDRITSVSSPVSEKAIYRTLLASLAIIWSTGLLNVSFGFPLPSLWPSPAPPKPYICHPPLPTVLRSLPSPPTSPQLLAAARGLDAALTLRAAAPEMDSMAVAVVTPSGPIFSKTYGVLRANETEREKQGKPDEDSLYRIASISKMFNAFEMMVLRERGLLNWRVQSLDDPVEKYLKNFTYRSGGWDDYLTGRSSERKSDPITLRQLATHMSGIGRTYPPVNAPGWPKIDPRKDNPVPAL
ncbi:hypothetical protein FRB90_011364 [Tulasnella sp. 427]|nr:hypothetical protein FRB90_011364 [Tulasnella sp. 427]